jgi:hypothetical protein
MIRRVLCIALVGVAVSLIAAQSSSANDGSGYFGGGVSTTAPVTNAGLYPMPTQNVPPRMGGTYITNPALYPHEFLYAHQHHYLAPPFHHVRKTHPLGFLSKFKKSKDGCCEACQRCGSCDCNGNCTLRGTEIIVRYKSRRNWLHTLFLQPR